MSQVTAFLDDKAIASGPGPAAARDAAYRFMQAMCGDRPDYEEALRSLYRGDRERFRERIAAWPEDIRACLGRLLG